MNVRHVLYAVIALALAAAGFFAFRVSTERVAAPTAAETPAPPAPKPAPSLHVVDTAVPMASDPYDPAVARRITADEVKARLGRGERILFVDTRAEIPDKIVKGAAQVTPDKLAAWAARTPKSSFVVVYCTCSQEATSAAEVVELQKLGFKNAYALLDGLIAWEALGLPTEPPPR